MCLAKAMLLQVQPSPSYCYLCSGNKNLLKTKRQHKCHGVILGTVSAGAQHQLQSAVTFL